MRFGECGEVLYGRFSLKIKVYQLSVRTSILHESKTWCLKKREVEFLRTGKSYDKRVMCKVKLIDPKTTKKIMQMLDVIVPIKRMVRTAAVRWHGHILQREEGNIQNALNFKLEGE